MATSTSVPGVQAFQAGSVRATLWKSFSLAMPSEFWLLPLSTTFSPMPLWSVMVSEVEVGTRNSMRVPPGMVWVDLLVSFRVGLIG